VGGHVRLPTDLGTSIVVASETCYKTFKPLIQTIEHHTGTNTVNFTISLVIFIDGFHMMRDYCTPENYQKQKV
jgi:uridine kinase